MYTAPENPALCPHKQQSL